MHDDFIFIFVSRYILFDTLGNTLNLELNVILATK